MTEPRAAAESSPAASVKASEMVLLMEPAWVPGGVAAAVGEAAGWE